MSLLRKHWYDIGAALSVIVFTYIAFNYQAMTNYRALMWFSLITLFLHQFEEYRLAGTFPGMVNTVMYNSKMPDRYPLNTNTALYVNVFIGWTLYLFAAITAEKAIWLGISTIMVSLGNTIAHTIVFNIKGRTFYNAGLFTSIFLFMPCAWLFFAIIENEQLVKPWDYFIGIPLGIVINGVGILKLIDWMADENTPYFFEERNLLPKNRNQNIN